MMEKDEYLPRFRKMLTFKLNLMGLNILSETFAASKMLIAFSIKIFFGLLRIFN